MAPPGFSTPNRIKKHRRKKRKIPWGIIAVSTLLLSGPLWCVFREWQNTWLEPEAIFVMGGYDTREHLAAALAVEHPNIHVWVSSGSPPNHVRNIFQKQSVDLNRLHLDYKATDTVTNFTTMVHKLRSKGVHSVYLVTSEGHMDRSRLVGEIIFGINGITVKPVGVQDPYPQESWEKAARDGLRAMLWIFTGNTGAGLANEFEQLNY